MKTLKLFNAVLSKETIDSNPFISKDGYVIEPSAIWAKDKIVEFYRTQKLNGEELNKTFHKSWSVIKNSTREELLMHQLMHYFTTYGTNFKAEMYIPDEVLNVPNVKLKFKTIKALTSDELTDRCLSLLKSGVALTEETIDDVFQILDDLNYEFTGNEGIRNKEAIIKIADAYGIYPSDTMEFFRYIIYRSTGQTLLIKNDEMISMIKSSSFNPTKQFKNHGLENLATIFNRFKPLFLAYKTKCPKVINKISKLSKTNHKPLVENPLNNVTNRELLKSDTHWLDNATPYALFKAISSLHNRMNGQTAFVHRIRNGKSWTRQDSTINDKLIRKNFTFITRYLKKRFDLNGLRVFLPTDVEYALPTSEKMFVGNIPTGTKFIGKKLAAGVYWENGWGAHDLDVSGLNIGGKIGWNSSYNQGGGNLMYSGDITNAPNGAVEYMYANNGLKEPTLVMNNVYSGSPTCGYKIVVGKGSKVSRDFMMNPNKVMLDEKTNSVQNNTVIGMFIPREDGNQTFVLLNMGAGHANVSGWDALSDLRTTAFFQEWSNPYTLNKLLTTLGAEIVDDVTDVDVNLSLDSLDKDTFINIFNENKVEKYTE